MVTVVIAVEINDLQFAVCIDHHIADVIVTVLIHLRSVLQQMSVLSDKVQKQLSVFVFERTLGITFDFSIDFIVKTCLPICNVVRCGNRVDSFQDFPCLKSVCILLSRTHRGDRFFCILAVNPALNGINPFVASAEFQRPAHRNPERRYLLHHFKFLLFALALRWIGKTVEVFVSVHICCAILFVPRPSFFDFDSIYNLICRQCVHLAFDINYSITIHSCQTTLCCIKKAPAKAGTFGRPHATLSEHGMSVKSTVFEP